MFAKWLFCLSLNRPDTVARFTNIEFYLLLYIYEIHKTKAIVTSVHILLRQSQSSAETVKFTLISCWMAILWFSITYVWN